jgi:hypothetical protein
MSDTIYADIADARLADIAELMNVGGPTWTRTRRSGDGVTAAKTETVTAGVGPLWLMPKRLQAQSSSLPGVLVTLETFVWNAAPGFDLQAGDEYTDGTTTAIVSGEPSATNGVLEAPADIQRGTA